MVVDVGAAVSNGFALANGTANKPNSYFSIGAGVVSYGFAAAAFASTDDTKLAWPAALMMGSTGTAALVTGVLGLRQVNLREESQDFLSRIQTSPTIVSDGKGHSGPGIQFKLSF
jgi:hypothetical protein